MSVKIVRLDGIVFEVTEEPVSSARDLYQRCIDDAQKAWIEARKPLDLWAPTIKSYTLGTEAVTVRSLLAGNLANWRVVLDETQETIPAPSAPTLVETACGLGSTDTLSMLMARCVCYFSESALLEATDIAASSALYLLTDRISREEIVDADFYAVENLFGQFISEHSGVDYILGLLSFAVRNKDMRHDNCPEPALWAMHFWLAYGEWKGLY